MIHGWMRKGSQNFANVHIWNIHLNGRYTVIERIYDALLAWVIPLVLVLANHKVPIQLPTWRLGVMTVLIDIRVQYDNKLQRKLMGRKF